MLQSLEIRLETKRGGEALLLETEAVQFWLEFHRTNAFELKLANKYELEKPFYEYILEQFNMSAQFAFRIIKKMHS